MTDTVLGKKSVVQIIWNSHVFKEWFQNNCKHVETYDGQGNQVKNLKASKHRFESFQKPLGRLLLWLPAVIWTMHQITTEREGTTEATTMLQWVKHLSAEKLLMLAMMADASDEGLCLIRQVDDESTDIASLQSLVVCFLERTEMLFEQGGCLQVMGYTRHIVSILEGDCGLHALVGEHVLALKAPSQVVISRCLERMRCWRKLACAVIQAEFPDCYLLSSFAVFDVNNCDGNRNLSTTTETQIQRLAKAFKVDLHHLRAQVEQLRPVVASIARQLGCGNNVAWKQALDKTQRTTSSRNNYPMDSLLPVLQRYMAWTSSSSGVEQNFSKAERARIDRTPASETAKAINLTPILNSRPEERTQVCARAQEIYAATFGSVRLQRHSVRVDKGIKRKRRSVHGSEADWLRRRRLAVKDATKDRPGVSDGTLRMQGTIITNDDDKRPSQWCERHEKELQHQLRKKVSRQVEALRDGVLLLHEEGEVTRLLDNTVKKEKEADLRHLQRARRVHRKLGMLHRHLDWLQLKTLKTWCVPSRASSIAQKLATKGVNTTLDKMEARLFVVDNLDQPGERVQWLVALHGGWLVTVSQVLEGKGAFVKYMRAVSRRRLVYMTSDFCQQHPQIAKIVGAACSSSGTKWRLLHTREEYMKHRTHKDAVALVCSHEARETRLPGKLRTKGSFLDAVMKIDQSSSGGFAREAR